MSSTISRFIRNYSIYSVVFFLYLALFIFTGFFLHIYINHWTLISAFVSYSLFIVIFLIARHTRTVKVLLLIASLVSTSLIFWGLTTVFGHTYDTSYDGLDYHQSAVIELSNNWNPVYQKSLPIKLTNKTDTPVISGYGKIIWSIDSSIYKLTHNIDSATSINLIVGFLAFVLLYFALRGLRIDIFLSLITAFLSVVTTLYVEQIFTLREDAISYEFLIIGISSIILLLKTKNKLPYLLCLLTALIFIAGTKDSNLFIFLVLLVMSVYVVLSRNIYKLKSFKITAILGIVVSFITFFNPYITNLIRYQAIDYPFNQQSFSKSIRYDNVPFNLRNDGRLKLLYYGIFSSAVTGGSQSPNSNAHIKVPFTLSETELLAEASAPSKSVGGYGVFFSGIFILSVGTYLYLAIEKKSKTEMKIFGYLSLVLVTIIVSCLLSPVPNYARYGSQLSLFPIAITVALLLIGGNKWKKEKIVAIVILVLLACNIFPDILIASAINAQSFSKINSQLFSLKNSDSKYLVYSGTFYSDIIRLKSHDIKIVVSQKPIDCSNKIILYGYAWGNPPGGMELCKLTP